MTLLVWALAAASVVFWGLKLSATGNPPLVPPVTDQAQAGADAGLMAAALGALKAEAKTQATAPSAGRFALVGMVASDARRGVALITVDGKPARAVKVGTSLEDGLLLQSVTPRSATLAADMNGPARFVLELNVPKN